MTFEVSPPSTGTVTLTLNWREAEILTRLVGMCNSGNLQDYSPELAEFVENMVKHVGRNKTSEAEYFLAHVTGGQVYISVNAEF